MAGEETDRVTLAREAVESAFSLRPLDAPAEGDRAAIKAAAARLKELYDAATEEERPQISAYAGNLALLASALDLGDN